MDPQEALVAKPDIAAHLGLSAERVKQLVISKGFPEPVRRFGNSPVWSTEEVIAWAKKEGREWT